MDGKRVSGKAAAEPCLGGSGSAAAASLGSEPAPVLVRDGKELAARCEEWRSARALAVDTEFVRTRTFFAQLGLLQIGHQQDRYLIDAVEIEDLSPLEALFSDPGVVKVVHSAAEDLEVLYQVFGVFPLPLFDTQIAAVLAGYGSSPGYQRLVKMLFDYDLPKAETRSDWLRRPLSAAQVEYASLDVAFLLPGYERLSEELEQRGRTSWAGEEFDRLVASTRSRADPEYTYRRLRGGGKYNRRELALLGELSAWREEEARERDLPRGFVISDETLIQLVRKCPTRPEQLGQIKGLRRGERARSGDELVRRIGSVLDLPASELPADDERHRPAAGRNRGRVDSLRKLVQTVAAELDVPPEFLARRRLLEELVRNVRSRVEEPLPEELRGWRRQVIGDRLLALARGSARRR